MGTNTCYKYEYYIMYEKYSVTEKFRLNLSYFL